MGGGANHYRGSKLVGIGFFFFFLDGGDGTLNPPSFLGRWVFG